MLLGAGFYLGLSVFTRIVRSIVAPLDDLIMVTTGVANQAMAESALENLPRPAADFGDEVGKLADAFNLMLDSIIRRDAQMRTQALRLEQLVEDLRSLSARMRAVREEERTRISHEIHDELGQRLTSLKYEVARLAPGDAGRVVAGQIDELIRVVRVISWELRPSVLDSLGSGRRDRMAGAGFRTTQECALQRRSSGRGACRICLRKWPPTCSAPSRNC
jgi:signal transduction histidine kinase